MILSMTAPYKNAALSTAIADAAIFITLAKLCRTKASRAYFRSSENDDGNSDVPLRTPHFFG
jgi:hypothetical protein